MGWLGHHGDARRRRCRRTACIVVDPDVDIYDIPADLMWALTSRVDWGRDVFTVPGAQGHEINPANDAQGIGTKIGIDATDKGRRDYLGRVHYNPVDLNNYLGAHQP